MSVQPTDETTTHIPPHKKAKSGPRLAALAAAALGLTGALVMPASADAAGAAVPASLGPPPSGMVAGGGLHSLALSASGRIYAWGSNVYGQLGDGTTRSSTTPVETQSPAGEVFVEITGGYVHSLALTRGGDVYAWGLNSDGRLGNGGTTGSTVPVKVVDVANVTSIAAGTHHSLAVTDTGEVYGWGSSTYGQLGNGTTDSSARPVVIEGLAGKNVVGLAAGQAHSLAVTSDNRVYAWGANWYGQLGDNTTDDSPTPVEVEGLAGKGWWPWPPVTDIRWP
jgi:alpha-tubulin suppressor-like RCC1 family protein